MERSDYPSRRDALRTLTAGTIGAVASAGWVDSLAALSQAHGQTHAARPAMAAAAWKPRALTRAQNETVIVLTELIIPQTETPGAKAVNVNRFIDGVLQVAASAERDAFFRGLSWMDARSTMLYGKPFAAAAESEQIALLTRVADGENTSEGDRSGVEFFRAIKSMTITGYYSTEVGLRQELGDDGRLVFQEFEGCTHPEHGV